MLEKNIPKNNIWSKRRIASSIFKKCIKCHEIKEHGEKQGRCKECMRIYSKNRYKSNEELREKCIKKARKLSKARYASNKAMVNEYRKNHPCVDCGNADIRVLDFDHRDPAEKSFCISWGYHKRPEQIMKEIEKCDIRCANCHRIKHHEEKHGQISNKEGAE